MSRGGYVTSMAGGVLALVFAVLMLLTGLLWAVGGDLVRFFGERGDRVGSMWKLLGVTMGWPISRRTTSQYVTEYKELQADKLKGCRALAINTIARRSAIWRYRRQGGGAARASDRGDGD